MRSIKQQGLQREQMGAQLQVHSRRALVQPLASRGLVRFPAEFAPVRVAANGNGTSNGTITLLNNPTKVMTVEYTLQAEEFVERKTFALPKPAPAAPAQPARTRTVLMAGNWKCNPTSVKDAKELAALVASAARTAHQDKPGFERALEVAVFPPYPFLGLTADALAGTVVRLGAQDVYPAAKGAFTGAVAPGMLSSLGCSYVLAGHSERRVLWGESDEEINKKVKAILAAGMRPILCIGESKEQYEASMAKHICASQLRAGLKDVSLEDMSKVVIAYEPVWAIGTGLTATPAIAQAIHAFIRSELAHMHGCETANKVRIQYGGSVTPETVDDLMQCPDIDGCLIGGASLAADKFARIFSYQEQSTGPLRLFASEAVACGNTLGESVVWSDRLQTLFWVDSMGQALWSWDLKGTPNKWDAPDVLGCVALMEGGDLLLGLQTGIFAFNPSSGAARLLSDFEPKLNTRPNDGRVDRRGNFVIGSYNNAHRQDGQEIGGLWRLTADGHLREILDYKFRCSNCVCFSPDGSTMYFTDTPTRRIFAFDYNPAGKLSNRRLLYEMPSHLPGGPDGAQTDAEGYLWACLSGASQVVRLHPVTGAVAAVVELPVTSPTCCTFGGPDLDTLYITTRKPDGGALFAVRLPNGVRGVPEPEFRGGQLAAAAAVAARGAAVAAAAAPAMGYMQQEAVAAGSSSAGSNGWLAGLRAIVGSGHGSASAYANSASVSSTDSTRIAYCDQCGTPYRSSTSKFCSECGTQRS